MTDGDVALLDALDGGDPSPLRDWLGTALADAGMAPERLSALAALGRWNDGGTDGGEGLAPVALSALREAVELSRGRATLGTLLAAYVRHECNAAWEISWNHAPVRTAVTTATSAAAGEPASPAAAAWALLGLLDDEMLVESAAATGTLTPVAETAGRTADRAESIERLCSELPADPLVEHLAGLASREACYYRALATAAAAAADTVRTRRGPLRRASAALAEAEDVFADDDACRSELRAHRAAIDALAGAVTRPWLRITSGTVVYVYPFGLRNVTAGTAVDALRRTGARWELAGLPVTAVAPDLPLNDVWDGNDPLGRSYQGAAVSLPDLLVPDSDRGEPHRLRVELRLTQLGNHSVRIEAPLDGAGPQALYAALTRAAPEAADLIELGTPVTADTPGAPAWGRLSDLAAELSAHLCEQFATHAGLPGVAVSTRGGTYHVVTRIQEAEAVDADGTAETVPDPDRLTELVGGALLDHPVRHGVSALAEWARYPAGTGRRIAAPGLVDDLVVRTENTTTIVAPSAPSYMIDPLQEAAEFVASLDGLFAGWQVELADHYYRITQEMERLGAEMAPAGPGAAVRDPAVEEAELDQRQHRLEAAQHEMQLFVMASRLRLMFITAPSLVTSPVVRTMLDHLLDAAGFAQARADFVGTADDVVGDRAWALIASAVRRRRELADARRREAEQRAEARRAADEARGRQRMDILLAAVAAVGISGILSILQAGYDLRGWLSVALVVLALVSAAAAGAITHRLTSPALRTARGGARADHPGP